MTKSETDTLVSSGKTAVEWIYAISHQSYFQGDRAHAREIAENLKKALVAVEKRRRGK